MYRRQAGSKIFRKGILLVLIPLFFDICFVCTLSVLQQESEQAAARANRINTVLMAAHDLATHFTQGMYLTFWWVASRNQALKAEVERLITTEVPQDVEIVKRNLSANPDEEKLAAKVDLSAREVISTYRYLLAMDNPMRALGGRPLAADVKVRVSSSIEKILQANREIDDTFAAERKELPAVTARLRQRVRLAIYIGVAINVLMAIALAYYFSRAITGRISIMFANTDRFARQLPLLPQVGGDDELSTLDAAFHAMSAALDTAMRKERAILDNAVDVICALDPSGKFTAINAACLRAWGYSNEAILSKELAEITDQTNHAKLQGLLAQTRSSNKPVGAEVETKGADGAKIWSLWSLQWSEVEQGYFCVVHDVSESRRLESLKQEFLQMVTHDIRIPVTSVRTFLGNVATGVYGEMPARLVESGKIADRSLSRVYAMVSDLLDLEKIESGTMKLKLAKVRVDQLCQEAVDIDSAEANQRDVLLTLDSADVMTMADEKRLLQVLVNLLGNAIKVSPSKSTVRVATELQDGRVQVTVSDQGPGIPEADLTRVFERFSQVATPRSAPGIGLGLAICKSLVELHGGQIWACNSELDGACFSFTIPVDLTAATLEQSHSAGI